MKLFLLLFYLILIFLGVSFAALNATPVAVNFYLKTITLPISVMMTLAMGVGVIIGFLLFLFRYFHVKAEYRKIKNQLYLTEKEIKNLRSIPLQDQH